MAFSNFCCHTNEKNCEQLVFYPHDRNRPICIDQCLIPEIFSLWLRGIETVGCCCGHFEKESYIQVDELHQGSMEQLGYRRLPTVQGNDGFAYGLNCFAPKTPLEFRGYLGRDKEL